MPASPVFMYSFGLGMLQPSPNGCILGRLPLTIQFQFAGAAPEDGGGVLELALQMG